MISANRVHEIVVDCLFRGHEIIDGKPIVDPIVGQGILRDFGFHPNKIELHRTEIYSMLMQLPDNFKKSGGGGWTFLNACMTRDGVRWGEHENMEELFALGIALKLAKFILPRDMWNILPGGMPYIVIED